MTDDPFAEMHSALFGAFGKPAQYKPDADSALVPVTVIDDRNMTKWADSVNVAGASAILSIDATTIGARPNRGAYVQLGSGKAWWIEGTEIDDGSAYVCRAVDA